MCKMKEKVVIITGASEPNGIGNAIAKRLAAEGALLFLIARNRENLKATADQCLALNKGIGRVEFEVFDLSVTGAAEAMVKRALDLFGRVDVLINNAVYRDWKNFGDFTRESFNRAIAVNLASPFFACQAVTPAMRNQGGGRIINIASQMGLVAFDKRTLYGMTKAALIYLTKAMAYELAGEGIMVNAISPGPILTQRHINNTKNDSAEVQSRLSYVRSKRFGKPEEIAEVTLFLASTEATFLQGDNIVVDGGYTTH